MFADGIQIGIIRFGDKEGRVLIFRAKQESQGTSYTRMAEEQELDFTAEQLETITSELNKYNNQTRCQRALTTMDRQ